MNEETATFHAKSPDPHIQMNTDEIKAIILIRFNALKGNSTGLPTWFISLSLLIT